MLTQKRLRKGVTTTHHTTVDEQIMGFIKRILINIFIYISLGYIGNILVSSALPWFYGRPKEYSSICNEIIVEKTNGEKIKLQRSNEEALECILAQIKANTEESTKSTFVN